MPTTRRLAASAAAGVVVLLLCGCTPRPPGFAVVGRDSHGATVGAMVVCSDPPDHAVFEATGQLEKSPPAGMQARWQFKREALQRGPLITWALLGSTDRDSVRSLATLDVAPEDEMSLYVKEPRGRRLRDRLHYDSGQRAPDLAVPVQRLTRQASPRYRG